MVGHAAGGPRPGRFCCHRRGLRRVEAHDGFRYDDGGDHSRESRDDRDNFFIVRRWPRRAAGGGELGGRGRYPGQPGVPGVQQLAAGYSLKYPEGWAQQGSGDRVTFRDKNNIVRIVVGAGAAPSHASVQADVAHLGNAQIQAGAQQMTISGKPAFKVVYSTESAPNAVTGKRVELVVDRYYLWKGGRRAVVDLGTPEGVDNVDAYRLMIESFRWS